MDKHLLDILCCPVSKTPIKRIDASQLEALNRAINAGEVQTVDGAPVNQPLRAALITTDDKVIYRIEDDIPVMLAEEGIGTTQLNGFPPT